MSPERRKILTILEMMELKEVPRMGWVVRGVRDGESVADHSFGVALLTLLLGPEEGIDVGKALKIAVVHDLAESVLGDIPTPAAKLMGEAGKEVAEEGILSRLLQGHETKSEIEALWKEFRDRSTPEGRFVRAVDKLEMFLQAFQYEREGNRRLWRFWTWEDNLRDLGFPVVEKAFEELLKLREEDNNQQRSPLEMDQGIDSDA
jgi:putative hydrolase of HD superfamily